jgi:steroid delta-isomerase-like uncharacterized protein
MKVDRIAGVLLALIAVCTILGCDKCADIESRNKEIVTEAFAAIDRQDFRSLDKYFAQDYHRYCQASPEAKVESLDDMVGFLKEWYDAFPDASVETHMMAAEGDLVAVYITFAGTHTAPMGDIPATGKRMESETFGFHRLKDGKIVETWVTWDNVAILKQLGLFPPPAPEQTQETP